MFDALNATDSEPPLSTLSPLSSSNLNSPYTAAQFDNAEEIMLTAAPPQADTHAVVIGRHTLPSLLTLVKSGCTSVTAHSLNAPSVHLDKVALAWLEGIQTREDLDVAIQVASSCLCDSGCMVLNASWLAPQPAAAVTVLDCLSKIGFRLRSVFRRGSHLILVAARRPELALAA